MMSQLLPLALGLLMACGDRDPAGTADDTGPRPDGGATDGGADSGTGDGGTGDGGTTDGGTTDGGTDTGEDCPDPLTWFYDADGDGWGDSDLPLQACDAPAGYVEQGGDCDDISPLALPGGIEQCADGLDNDCEGGDAACELPPSGLIDSVATRVRSTTSEDDTRQPVALGDVDGDGVADLVLGRPEYAKENGRAEIHLGPLDADRDTPDLVAAPLDLSGDGPAIASAVHVGTDYDGDGLADLVIGAPGLLAPGRGGAWIASGPLAGDVTLDVLDAVQASSGVDGLGATLAGGRDLTGDDQPDLVLGACCDGASASWVLPGPVGVGEVRDLGTALYPAATGLQSAIDLAVGDVDGDGIGDLVVGEAPPDSGPQPGRACLLQGPLDADRDLDDADTLLRSTEAEDLFGFAVALGDLDDDGLDDLVVGAPLRAAGDPVGMVSVLLDAADQGDLTDLDASSRLLGTSVDPFIGASLATQDLDGDGRPELLIGTPGIDAMSGGVLILDEVSTSGTITTPLRRYSSGTGDAWLGWWMDAGPDATGDGVGDVVIAGVAGAADGEAWLLPGQGG